MILFLHQNLTNVLGDREFAERLALLDALPIVANRFILVVQIELQHFLGFLGRFDFFRRHLGHSPQVVDLICQCERVLQLLASVHFELGRDVHVFSAL